MIKNLQKNKSGVNYYDKSKIGGEALSPYRFAPVLNREIFTIRRI